MNLKGKKVLVTGGASFIGSHLVDKLIEIGAKVYVVDNLSTGKIEYINHEVIWIYRDDLKDVWNTNRITEEMDVVFHLAAVHGGREFIDKYPSEVAQSFTINDNVIRSCHLNNVKKLVFSSSVCIYPLSKQTEIGHPALSELDDGFDKGEYAPDGMYGLTKLAAEIEMKTYAKQYGLKCGIARFSTVYGPRMNNTHALMALLERALKHEDPYIVWGNGMQGRDWLYVDDAVTALIRLAEEEDDATSYNIVSSKTLSINEVIEQIFREIDWRPEKILYDIKKPVGPIWRTVSMARFNQNIGYFAKTDFNLGLRKLIKYAKDNL